VAFQRPLAHPWQLTVGRLISMLSALALVALALFGWRRRRRSPPPPPPADTGRAADHAPSAVRV